MASSLRIGTARKKLTLAALRLRTTEQMKLLPVAACLFVAGTSAVASAQPSRLPDVVGHWKVMGWTLPQALPVRGFLPVLKFSGAGQALAVTGKAGCNYINGPVTLQGNQLTFGVLVSTRIACSVAVGQQETALINTLSGQTLTAVRAAHSLTLTTKGGSELRLRRYKVRSHEGLSRVRTPAPSSRRPAAAAGSE
ncbi:MAG: hypothetical protein JWQ08_1501 [Deinococcus sp.]|jgi:hypothetical protein|nr:hypothetical protein [Deinococcus sp.]